MRWQTNCLLPSSPVWITALAHPSGQRGGAAYALRRRSGGWTQAGQYHSGAYGYVTSHHIG
ncbi:hypothetical protein M1P56_10300 [Streptomyces sp. HU2014]|uniref:hypothetical protein n=1 Tax=Streptomyces TaxID=1883 RepID=UPI001331B4CE|nr:MULTISPECIES: hypothetical protein [Streptomyces]UQI44710.1 hypothetical protein M1P56_10300 [Streptomyces sp. HU2014]